MNEILERQVESTMRNDVAKSAKEVGIVFNGIKNKWDGDDEEGFIDLVTDVAKMRAKNWLQRMIRPRS